MKKNIFLLFAVMMMAVTVSAGTPKSGIVGFFPQDQVWGRNFTKQEVVNFLKFGKFPAGLSPKVLASNKGGTWTVERSQFLLKQELKTKFWEAFGVTPTDDQLYEFILGMEEVLFTGTAVFNGLEVVNGRFTERVRWNDHTREPYLKGKEKILVDRNSGIAMSLVCLNIMKTKIKPWEPTVEPAAPEGGRDTIVIIDTVYLPSVPPTPQVQPPVVINCPPTVVNCGGNGQQQPPVVDNGATGIPAQEQPWWYQNGLNNLSPDPFGFGTGNQPSQQQPIYQVPTQNGTMVPAGQGSISPQQQQPQKRTAGEKFASFVNGAVPLAVGGASIYNGVKAVKNGGRFQ